METETDSRTAAGLRALGVATVAWLLLSSTVGYLILDLGRACSTSWDDEYRPLGQGAEAVCGGGFPYTPTFLTFVAVTFIGIATLVLRWGTTTVHPWRLCGGVAALPVLAFGILRGVSLIP